MSKRTEFLSVRCHHHRAVRDEEGLESLKTNLRHGAWILALVFGIGITGSTAWTAGSASPQDQTQVSQDRDYSKNKNYQQGMRDGKDDRAKNLDHSKKRHFKTDSDQKDYETGYQTGHQGDQQK